MSGCAAGWAQASGWVLPGAEYTDAMAVAAVETARGYDFDLYQIPLVVATATRTRYRLITTAPLLAGTWSISVAMFVTGTNSGTDTSVDVEINGNALGEVLSQAIVPGGGFVHSATVGMVLAAGPLTVEYFVRHPSSPGSLTVILSTTTWVMEVSA